MRKRAVIILLMLVMLLTTSVVVAEGQESSFTFNIGELDGETSYTIRGDESGGWKSELVFPLDTTFLKVDFSKELKQENLNVNSINLQLLKNLDNEDNGVMKDSDWSQNKSTYSESKVDLNALIFKIEGESKLKRAKNFKYLLQTGYKLERFRYNVSNHETTEYDYSSDELSTYPGDILKYKVTYHIPYVGIEFDYSKESPLNYNIEFNYSPFVQAKDVNDYPARDKRSEGDTDGNAVMFAGELRYNLEEDVDFLFVGSYTKVDTDGEQDQYFYAQGTEYNNIDQDIELEQYKFTTGIQHKF